MHTEKSPDQSDGIPETEQKFNGIGALKEQIDKDIAKGMEYFGIV